MCVVLRLLFYPVLQCYIQAIGKAMQDWENRQPGRLMGFPRKSIYDGLKPPDGGEWEEDETPAIDASKLSSVAASLL